MHTIPNVLTKESEIQTTTPRSVAHRTGLSVGEKDRGLSSTPVARNCATSAAETAAMDSRSKGACDTQVRGYYGCVAPDTAPFSFSLSLAHPLMTRGRASCKGFTDHVDQSSLCVVPAGRSRRSGAQLMSGRNPNRRVRTSFNIRSIDIEPV